MRNSTIGAKISTALNGAKAKAAVIATTATAAVMPLVSHAGTMSSYSGATSDGIMSGLKSFIGTIGTYGGGLYATVAILTLVFAIRNEDNEGRNKAVLNLLAAIALLSMGLVLNFFFV